MENIQKLLKYQIFWLNRNDEKLYKKSKKIYFDYKENKLAEQIKSRCCNFPLIEEKCIEFIS